MFSLNSKEASSFINDEEIADTLKEAKANKNNIELLQGIIDKAKTCKGLNYKEAAFLLECEDEDINKQVETLAMQIKQKFYGNRIVMFAPLYLSNYCVNGCTYCPYHYKNKHIARKKLS